MTLSIPSLLEGIHGILVFSEPSSVTGICWPVTELQLVHNKHRDLRAGSKEGNGRGGEV